MALAATGNTWQTASSSCWRKHLTSSVQQPIHLNARTANTDRYTSNVHEPQRPHPNNPGLLIKSPKTQTKTPCPSWDNYVTTAVSSSSQKAQFTLQGITSQFSKANGEITSLEIIFPLLNYLQLSVQVLWTFFFYFSGKIPIFRLRSWMPRETEAQSFWVLFIIQKNILNVK